MMEMLLVGGIPYSGKSYLCNELAKKDPKYKDLSIDKAYGEVENDATKFFYNLSVVNPGFLKTSGIRLDDAHLDSKLNNIKNSMHVQAWDMMLQLSAMTLHTRKLMNTGLESVPMVESLFYTRDARELFYESSKDYMELVDNGDNHFIDLDSVKKTMVYFDLGLEISLHRYSSDKGNKPLVNEGVIIQTHFCQQLPKKDEFPNLDVIILKNQDQVHEFIEGKN